MSTDARAGVHSAPRVESRIATRVAHATWSRDSVVWFRPRKQCSRLLAALEGCARPATTTTSLDCRLRTPGPLVLEGNVGCGAERGRFPRRKPSGVLHSFSEKRRRTYREVLIIFEVLRNYAGPFLALAQKFYS